MTQMTHNMSIKLPKGHTVSNTESFRVSNLLIWSCSRSVVHRSRSTSRTLTMADITIDTITDFVSRLLTPEQQREFLSPGYRIRIVKWVSTGHSLRTYLDHANYLQYLAHDQPSVRRSPSRGLRCQLHRC